MKKLLTLITFILFIAPLQAQNMMVLSSNYMPAADTVLIYTPSDYSPAAAYPAVFMLHGWDGNYRQWDIVTGGLQAYADKYKFIIVCPDGLKDCWYTDSPVNKQLQFEKFFFNKLAPEVFGKYKIDKSKVFITGLSMGGHGAMTLFFKHPSFFRSAGSTSGILDITAFPGKWSMEKVYGSFEANPDYWRKGSAVFLLMSSKNANKEIIFDCGTEDFAYQVNKQFYDKCLSYKTKATFISRPGAHTRNYWALSIDDHFRFFSRLAGSM